MLEFIVGAMVGYASHEDEYVPRPKRRPGGLTRKVASIRKWIEEASPPPMTRWPPSHFTARQRQWCVEFDRKAGLDPLMDQYVKGVESFKDAMKKSRQEAHSARRFFIRFAAVLWVVFAGVVMYQVLL